MIQQVSIPASFFRKERNQFYAYWRLAFWRELFQNSVDARAGRIDVRLSLVDGNVHVVFSDNGHGMTEQVLRDVYFRLGESTKSGGDTVGGFGRARILTNFSQKEYEILTGNCRVVGQGASYEITQLAKPVVGCEVRVTTDDTDLRPLTRALDTYLSQSKLDCAVYVDGTLRRDSTHAGREVRELSLDDKVWGRVFVNKSGGKHGGMLIVRVSGSAMYDYVISSDAQVIVEIEPELSREVLLANRDGLHTEYNRVLEAFLREITRDTRTALKDRRHRRTCVRQSRRGMITVGAPTSPLAVTGRDSQASNLGGGVRSESRFSSAPVSDSSVETKLGILMNSLPTIYIHDEAELPQIRKIIPQYDPINWGQADTHIKGFTKAKLLVLWNIALQHALNSLVKVRGQSVRYAIGFRFEDASIAASHGEQDGGHVFLLNPVTNDGKLAYSLRDKLHLKRLMAYAKHEVAHIVESWHGQDFANALTEIDCGFSEKECYREMLAALNALN